MVEFGDRRLIVWTGVGFDTYGLIISVTASWEWPHLLVPFFSIPFSLVTRSYLTQYFKSDIFFSLKVRTAKWCIRNGTLLRSWSFVREGLDSRRALEGTDGVQCHKNSMHELFVVCQ